MYDVWNQWIERNSLNIGLFFDPPNNQYELYIRGEIHQGKFPEEVIPVHHIGEIPQARIYHWDTGRSMDRSWYARIKSLLTNTGTLVELDDSDSQKHFSELADTVVQSYTKDWLIRLPRFPGSYPSVRLKNNKYTIYRQHLNEGPTWLAVLREKRVFQAALTWEQKLGFGKKRHTLLLDPKSYTKYGRWSDSTYQYLANELYETNFRNVSQHNMFVVDNAESIHNG